MSSPIPIARSGNFDAEEWETWMKWDGALDALSPHGLPQSPSFQFGSPSQGSDSTSGYEGQTAFRYSPPVSFVKPLPSPPQSKKRKSIGTNEKSKGKPKPPQLKKTSHNVIEKRYRSNLNDKISALRDSVPVLRQARKQPTATKDGPSDSEGSEEDGGNPNSGPKCNKATILAKATEYIHELERQNARLLNDNSTLRNRLHQNIRTHMPSLASTPQPSLSSTNPPPLNPPNNETPPSDPSTSATTPPTPTGLIPIPAPIHRLRTEALTHPHNTSTIPPYSHNPDPILDPGIPGAGRNRIISKLLLGSLAGLMIMEGFSETDSTTTRGKQKRGLFALPRELLIESRGFRDPIRRRIVAFLGEGEGAWERGWPVVRVGVVVVGLVWVLLVLQGRLAVAGSEKVVGAEADDSRRSQGGAQVVVQPALRQPPSRTRNPTDSKVVTLVYVLREFFARQAIGWVGRSVERGEVEGEDEEAGRFASLGAEAFYRRWLTYSQLLPKLLRDGGGG